MLFVKSLSLGPKSSLTWIHKAISEKVIEEKEEYDIRDYLKIRLWLETKYPLLISSEIAYQQRKLSITQIHSEGAVKCIKKSY